MMAKPKPKAGDYYWFTGAYESHIAGKALVVRKVIKGYECMVELVTKDGMFGWENPIRCDVRRLFGADEYETYKDWLEDVGSIPATPVTVKRDSAAKWKQRFEYLLRASRTEQTFLASHKSLDLVVKEIDDMLDNV